MLGRQALEGHNKDNVPGTMWFQGLFAHLIRCANCTGIVAHPLK